MKTNALPVWLTLCAAAVSLTPVTAAAEQTDATAALNNNNSSDSYTYTGTVEAVHPGQRLVDIKGDFWLTKTFLLGDHCAYMLWDRQPGALGNFRPGDRVTVSFKNANGQLVAERLEQESLTRSGLVKSLDPAAHTLTLAGRWRDETFQLPANCRIVLYNDKAGAIADVQPGDRVTITYETPNHQPTAEQIAQSSQQFTGKLTAIDLTDRTIKADAVFGSKTLHVPDNCVIVENGQAGCKLRDLKLGGNFAFSYNQVDGVDMVDRIAAAPSSHMETSSIQHPSP